MAMNRTREEVIEIISGFIDESLEIYDWDDFTSIPIRDTGLDKIRLECLYLPINYPPDRKGYFCNSEGIERLKSFLDRLKMPL